ncbi:MAG: M6 family metalloprotease domain-containing protein [Thermodesulfovibrionales bacterium]
MKARYIIAILFFAVLLTCSIVFALEPPNPSEIERLRQTGELPARLEQAKAIGNNLIDSYRLELAIAKAKREALTQHGFSADMIDLANPLPTPPQAWRGMPTTGTVKMFALLIDFSDCPHYNSRAGINSALFGDGSLIPDNTFPYESLASYYGRSSYDQLDLSHGVTLGWYRPAYTRASMPMTDAARESLIKEAISHFKGLGQDFSQFDNNGDGTIDYFAVIWTGPDNGWANFWWGQCFSRFLDPTFTVDGKKLGRYSWQWEYNNGGYSGPFSPRTIIHETGHALGVPDYYDYDDTVGPKGGVGGLDIMDAVWGDHNSFSKWVLDWLSPTVVASGTRSLTLNPSGVSKDAVLIMPGASAGDPFREFFIAQNRYRIGNDIYYPADGMLLWHVDATLDASGTNYLYDNSNTTYKLLKLMQADGLDRIENFSAVADAAMYYKPGNSLSPFSTPSNRDYHGVDTRVIVTGISEPGQQMSATFAVANTNKILNVSKAGTGSGTVTGLPAGIACGAACVESVGVGSIITLSATPDDGSQFICWQGWGCPGTGSCVVAMRDDVKVTARFYWPAVLHENFDAEILPADWTWQDNASGGWWWFMDEDGYGNTGGSGGYALGASYAAGDPNFDIELRSVTLDLSTYSTIGLEFKTDIRGSTADVDVSVTGATGPWTNVWRRTTPLPGPATVNVDLSALAAGHSDVMLRFHHYGSSVWWLLDDVKVTAGPAPKNLTITSSNPDSGVDITYSPANPCGHGGGTTPWTTGFSGNTYVTLTAPSTAGGNNFSSWSGCDSWSGTTCYVTMNASKTVIANYITSSISLTISTSPSGRRITVDGLDYTAPHEYRWMVGSSHTIGVTSPQSGDSGIQYVYSSWSDVGAPTHAITTPSSASTYTANFTVQYQLTTSVNQTSLGSVSPDCSGGCWYNSAASVSLFATPSDGNTFISWSGDISSLNVPLSFTMDGPKNITANYDSAAVTDTVRIVGSPPAYFHSITTAYGAAVNKDVIQMQATSYGGALAFNRTDIHGLSVTLKGGYNATYSDNTGKTTVGSPLTIQSGTIIVDNIGIQ